MTLIRKGNTAWFLQSPGRLKSDRYGVSSATAIWQRSFDGASSPGLPSGLSFGSTHPIWNTLKCDNYEVGFDAPFWTCTAEFYGPRVDAGGGGGPPPDVEVYELDWSVSEEPIETHPNFAATLAGTPTGPLNDADFDDKGNFVGFKATSSLRGVRGYLAPGVIWRKSYSTTTQPNNLGNVGKIVIPSGPVPSVPSGYNWLSLGITWQQKALIYQVREEWKLSGRNGWNSLIYI